MTGGHIVGYTVYFMDLHIICKQQEGILIAKTVHVLKGTLTTFILRVRENRLFIRESFAKVWYYESLLLYTLQLVKGYHLLPPRGPAGEGYRTFTFPFIGSNQIPWSWSTSLDLLLVLLNWSFKKQTPNAAAKFPKVMLCESQAPGVFSRKFRQSSAKERAKVKVHFEGSGPASLAKKNLISNNLS